MKSRLQKRIWVEKSQIGHLNSPYADDPGKVNFNTKQLSNEALMRRPRAPAGARGSDGPERGQPPQAGAGSVHPHCETAACRTRRSGSWVLRLRLQASHRLPVTFCF